MRKGIFHIVLLFISPALLATEPDTAFNALFRREIGGWIAADATYSISLPDGRTLWLFGDTFIGEVAADNSIVDGSDFIRNSAVIQDGEELTTLFTGTRENPSAFIPTGHPDSTWYWPEHGVVESDSLYLFAAKFRHKDNGGGGFDFEHAGNDIAVLTYPGLEFVRTFPIDASAASGILFGDRILEDTAYTYIYGRRAEVETNIPYPYVARSAPGEVHLQAWEYFDGTGWSADPPDAKRINDFQVSQQYSVSMYRGKYILLTQDIWLSPKIYSFTSESPTGPWSNKRLLYTTPETGGSTFTYNAYVHPQFDRDGEMLMSYNVNGDFWSIFSNVELYRPRFIRIPYMNLDFAFWPDTFEETTVTSRWAPKLYPNPVSQDAMLVIRLQQAGTLKISLSDVGGNRVSVQEPVFVSEGEHHVKVHASELPAGIYFCRVILNDRTFTLPLVRQ